MKSSIARRTRRLSAPLGRLVCAGLDDAKA